MAVSTSFFGNGRSLVSAEHLHCLLSNILPHVGGHCKDNRLVLIRQLNDISSFNAHGNFDEIIQCLQSFTSLEPEYRESRHGSSWFRPLVCG